MIRFNMPDDSMDIFNDVLTMLKYNLRYCENMKELLSRMQDMVSMQEETTEAIVKNFFEPLLEKIGGVSKTDESEPPRGAGGGEGTFIIFGGTSVESLDIPDERERDEVIEKLFDDGLRMISIPLEIGRLIEEKQNVLRGLVIAYLSSIKNVNDKNLFDTLTNYAVNDLSQILPVTPKEALYLLRLFVAQYLMQD